MLQNSWEFSIKIFINSVKRYRKLINNKVVDNKIKLNNKIDRSVNIKWLI